MKTLKFWNKGKKDSQQGGGDKPFALMVENQKPRMLEILTEIAKECACEPPSSCGCAVRYRYMANRFLESYKIESALIDYAEKKKQSS